MISQIFRAYRARDDLRAAPDAVLEDIGVTRAQLDFPLGSERATRWVRMARVTGADTSALVADLALLREVAARCAGCGSHRTCRRWLTQDDPDAAGFRAFCPNHAVFDDLPRDPGAGPRKRTASRERDVDLGFLTPSHPGFLGSGKRKP